MVLFLGFLSATMAGACIGQHNSLGYAEGGMLIFGSALMFVREVYTVHPWNKDINNG